jgi:hypothetical protein
VSRLFPHHIGAKQSGMHGSQVGWYAIDGEGDIRPASAAIAAALRPVSRTVTLSEPLPPACPAPTSLAHDVGEREAVTDIVHGYVWRDRSANERRFECQRRSILSVFCINA